MSHQLHKSAEWRAMMSARRLGPQNPNWKGAAVGLHALHRWVRRRLPKPEFCQGCNEAPPMDLANKGTYDRDLANWEWLCRRCHLTSDGRLAAIAGVDRRDPARRARVSAGVRAWHARRKARAGGEDNAKFCDLLHRKVLLRAQ